MTSPRLDLQKWAELGDELSTINQYRDYLCLPPTERHTFCKQAHVISFTTADKIQMVLNELCSQVRLTSKEQRMGTARKLNLHDQKIKKLLPSSGDQFAYFCATSIDDDRSGTLQSLSDIYNLAEREGTVQQGSCEEESTAIMHVLSASLLSRRSLDLLDIEGLQKLPPFRALTLERYSTEDLWEHFKAHAPHMS